MQQIAERIGRMLEKRGLIERDAENAWLSSDPSLADPLDDLIGSSITYRIAVGPRTGKKVFTLRTVPAQGEEGEGRNGAAQAGGFSLHAGVDIQSGQRAKLERLCRYVSQPPLAVERLALTASGQVRYLLKTPYRAAITPAQRGKGRKYAAEGDEPPAVPRHAMGATPEAGVRH